MGIWGLCSACYLYLYVGNACYSHVSKVLCKPFRSPQDVKKAFPRLLHAASVQTQVHQGFATKIWSYMLHVACLRSFQKSSPEEIITANGINF